MSAPYCACGTVLGSQCEGSRSDGRRVRLEWVPPHLRGTAEAAGHCVGLWEEIGLVLEDCAKCIADGDPYIRRRRRHQHSTDRAMMARASAVASLRSLGLLGELPDDFDLDDPATPYGNGEDMRNARDEDGTPIDPDEVRP